MYAAGEGAEAPPTPPPNDSGGLSHSPRPVGRYAPRPAAQPAGPPRPPPPLNSQGKWFSPRRFRVGPGGRAGGGDCGAGGGGGGEADDDDSPPALCGAGADYRAAVRSAEAPARPRRWVMARCRCRRLHKGGRAVRGAGAGEAGRRSTELSVGRGEHAAGRGGARQARPAATSRGGGVPGHVWPWLGSAAEAPGGLEPPAAAAPRHNLELRLQPQCFLCPRS